MPSFDDLFKEAKPASTVVKRGAAGIVVLMGNKAFKLQCVDLYDATWWSKGWGGRLFNMIDTKREMAFMEWGSKKGVAPQFHEAKRYNTSSFPAWLRSEFGSQSCDKVLVYMTDKVSDLDPAKVSLASVKRLVEACGDARLVIDDLRKDNVGLGRGGSSLVVLDWGEVRQVASTPREVAMRRAAEDLRAVLGTRGKKTVTDYLKSLAN